MRYHNQLYEINTRVWLHNLSNKLEEEITLQTVPEEYWLNLKEKGFNWIWLMGVWKHSPLTMSDLNRHSGLLKEIKESLPDWKPIDVIGSPYSIVKYELNPKLGQPNDLKRLKKKLNQMGVKLMLDFVPNHFGNASPLVKEKPDLFISSMSEPTEKVSLFKMINTEDGPHWVAFGKDPYFPPWDDTFQLNYFHPDTRKFMIDVLFQIENQCDGVRCDMAMLCLNDIIKKTWDWYLSDQGVEQPHTEFWEESITMIKNVNPNFTFLAEVYWDLGWQLQQLGFDFTYDKRLYDRLEHDSPKSIREHLYADLDYQKQSLRFIENHDERRVIENFGKEKSIAAAIVSGTIPGMCLYHQGQLEGQKVKIPVQLRRKVVEQHDEEIQLFYERLLKFTNQNVFKKGQWILANVSEAWEGNHTWKNFLAWQWSDIGTNQLSIILVNYASVQSQGRVSLNLANFIDNVEILKFEDNLTTNIYTLSSKEIVNQGLYVDLLPYKSHLFNVNLD